MLYDSYLNWIKVGINTQDKDDDFKGIIGIGEREQNSLFYKDGVYSLWGTDQPNPMEDGKLPGKQTYGCHPFFMYKAGAEQWVGVYYKIAQAQDWWVANLPKDGFVRLDFIAVGGVADIYVILSSQKPDTVI